MNVINEYRNQTHKIIDSCAPVIAAHFWIKSEKGATNGENHYYQKNRIERKEARNRLIFCRNLSRV